MHRSSGASCCVFFVTSVIDFKDKKLSYSSVRSKYSPIERIEQTKGTIRSIRNRVPNAYIIILEGGLQPYRADFENIVDEYYYLGDKKLVRWSVDSTNKSLGEAMMMLSSRILRFQDGSTHFFKISGRYKLNEFFSVENFPVSLFGFRHINGLSTKLYSLGNEKYWLFILVLVLCLPFLLFGRSIEGTLWYLMPKKYYKKISLLGVEGLAGPDGVFYAE